MRYWVKVSVGVVILYEGVIVAPTFISAAVMALEFVERARGMKSVPAAEQLEIRVRGGSAI